MLWRGENIVAIIYQKEHKKFSFFFKISMVFLALGIVLHILDWIFWGEFSYFICCAVILTGIVYIILHHITYFTGKKIERVVSAFFYTGIACFILRLLSSFLFKADYYVDISPCMEVYSIIIFCLKIGVIFLPLSVVMMFLKFKRLIKFLKSFF